MFPQDQEFIKAIKTGSENIGYRYNNLFDLQDGNLHSLENSQVAGNKGSIVSGIQFCITSDSRDNIYNTSKGTW